MRNSNRVWSSYQKAVFDHVDNNPRHLIVEALAGSGKTSTIVEALYHTRESESVLMVAFNKAIAEELKHRAPGDVAVMTLHSYGLHQIRNAHGDRKIDGYHVANVLRETLGRSYDLREVRAACAKVVSLGKSHIIDMRRHRDDLLGDLTALADAFGVFVPKSKRARNQGATPDRTMIVVQALATLQQCAKATEGPLDFDDMVWLPIVQNLDCDNYDRVFVDETQDLNAVQLELVLKACGEGGQIVAVGDRHQAIYGFRGAAEDAIPRMITRLDAEVLPLSITYRCPLAVVAEAQALVPALEPSPTAAEGLVRTVDSDTMQAEAKPGDFVISRTNAELVAHCLAWIAAGKRALIRGRDIGANLISVINQTGAETCAELRIALSAWASKEAQRLLDLDRQSAANAVLDTAACITAIVESQATVAGVKAMIESLFVADASGAIQLMSTHKSKGLEADCVWLLRDTFCRWPGQEESNLLYVGITRAKGILNYVAN